MSCARATKCAPGEILSCFQSQAKGPTDDLAVFECLDNPRTLAVAIGGALELNAR